MTTSDQIQLDEQQSSAALTLNRHMSVTAGPGSGKTTVLVARYLHILRKEHVDVEQIVAITFTNRAANEMRTRLRGELDRLMRVADPTERNRWLEHKRTLDSAVITTFHGFCARLLREFPIEAEIDPQFILMDETQSAMLIEAVAHEILNEQINADREQKLTRLVVGFGRESVARAAIKVYRTMRNQGLEPQEIEDATNNSHATEIEYRMLFEQTDELMRGFISLGGLSKAAESKRSAAASLWRAVSEILQDPPDITSLAQYCNTIERFRARARPVKSGKLAPIVAALDDLLWGEKSDEPFGRLPKTGFDISAREFAVKLVGLVKEIHQRLELEKRRTAALDFDDLHSRVLELFDKRPDVLRRIAGRYRYFLVDEFQDTNRQQRALMERLALSASQRANLFVVGDRKQSIYGFRGADVDVFRSMTEEIVKADGISTPLLTNFRSRGPLIQCFNQLFARAFRIDQELDLDTLYELGYVEHEESKGHRESDDDSPIIELLVDVREPDRGTAERPRETMSSRERDARQIASRILALVVESKAEFRDIALLFRAMINVSEYESVFRRLEIPYHTVQGKGFYAREEVTDLLHLLRFLDNTTDEIALAAVLRSPLCGLSDDALLALRRAPALDASQERGRMKPGRSTRLLFEAVLRFDAIAWISPDERAALERTRSLLSNLVENRSRMAVAELLRMAVEQTEFRSVVAANFDGAQRLANVDKIFELAERFERTGAHMIRDFVRYVEDFERTGGRESEGQIDESANAVRLMTIHQAKGQEFPVVVLPELTRELTRACRDWYMLDRTRGLTMKIPDGRGSDVSGQTLDEFRERDRCRNLFESMRLFYVAATRARDRIIFSGVFTKEFKADGKDQSCMRWAVEAFEGAGAFVSGAYAVNDDLTIRVYRNLADEATRTITVSRPAQSESQQGATSKDLGLESFPLLKPLSPERGDLVSSGSAADRRVALHRFSVTQLVNFQRCPRQYYFDRILQAPSAEELDAWNKSEAPEPPSNLTATLRGAVVHRFCETYRMGEDITKRLGASFDDIVAQQPVAFAGRIDRAQRETALSEMLPLAANYLSSEVAARIEAARAPSGSRLEANVFNERTFVIRRPLGTLSGILDKMLVTSNEDGTFDIEIIDFKTDKFPRRTMRPAGASDPAKAQPLFEALEEENTEEKLRREVEIAAHDYELQMQAYALAIRELVPNLGRLRVTILFLQPNIEITLAPEVLDYDVCAARLDEAMLQLLASAPANYPTRPANHCLFCRFRPLCFAGQQWFRSQLN